MKILKFEAPWCHICKAVNTELAKLKELSIKYIDVDEDEELTDKYNIRNLPTILIIDDSEKELYRFTGFVKAKEIKEMWNQLIK